MIAPPFLIATLIDTENEASRKLPIPSLQIRPVDNPTRTDQPTERQQLAYLVSTSGTTGRPKLVMIEHASLDNLVAGYQEILNLRTGDVRYQSTTESSDTFVLEVMLYLSSGATLWPGQFV